MKKILWVLLAFIVPFGMAFGPFSCDPKPPGYGLEFDGVNDYVNVGTLGDFGRNISEGNISFWVKTTETAQQDVFATLNDDTSTMLQVSIGRDGADTLSVRLRDDNGNRLYGYASVSHLTSGEWRLVEIYYKCSTDTIQISVDGERRAVSYGYRATPTSFSNFQYDLLFGGGNLRGSIGNWFQGQLADVRIDDGGRGGYWKFDEGSGATAADSSGNNNDGTLHGNPVWVTG